jgi:succinyl-diaminopimelate desuccinylase
VSDLLEVTSALVGVRSVSRSEGELAGYVESELRRHSYLSVERIGDNVVARSFFGRPRRVVLAGHLDTVPPFDTDGPRVVDDTLWGLGAVDMKGGLAVMLWLSGQLERAKVDVTLVFYACEEIERAANGLGQLARDHRELLEADAAVLVEPTGGVVEAGCQGTMRVQVTLKGRRAHAARPHMGLNALHRLGRLLQLVESYEPRTVVIDGCSYTERLQAVLASAGVAPNVVPDKAIVTLNHRFAPDRDVAEAKTLLFGMLSGAMDEALGDEIELLDAAAGAPPALSNPFLSRLVHVIGEVPRAKVGWTDVATFATLGIPATNFGPGDPLLAHTADEHVSVTELAWVRQVLETFLLADA